MVNPSALRNARWADTRAMGYFVDVIRGMKERKRPLGNCPVGPENSPQNTPSGQDFVRLGEDFLALEAVLCKKVLNILLIPASKITLV